MKYPIEPEDNTAAQDIGRRAFREGRSREWMERRHYSNDFWDQAVMIGWENAERDSREMGR